MSLNVSNKRAKINSTDEASADPDLQKIFDHVLKPYEISPETFTGELDGPSIIAAIKRNPSAARAKYLDEGFFHYDHFLPLHLAIKLGASHDVVDCIYRAFPEALNVKDDVTGQTVLHFACMHERASKEVVSLLLEKSPELVREKDKSGKLPLHTLCFQYSQYSSSLHVFSELISLLLNKYQAAVMTQDSGGSLPLHFACRNHAPIEAVSLLLEAYPPAAMTQNTKYETPLHLLFSNKNPDLDLVRLLLKGKYQAAAKVQDDEGFLPLHWACLRHAPIEAISLLLESDSTAVTAQNKQLETPLHLLFSNVNPDLDLVRLLLERYPKALAIKTNGGQLPLHCACMKKPSAELVSLLLRRNTAAVKIEDGDGKTPFHLACASGGSKEVLALLLEKYPGAVKMEDRYGNTPLHSLFDENELDYGSLLFLLEKLPEATKIKNARKETPLHHACQARKPLKMICLLIEMFPEAVKTRDYFERTPLDNSNGFFPWCGDDLAAQNDDEHNNITMVLTDIGNLLENDVNQSDAAEIMRRFINIEWWGGAALIFDLCPSAMKSLEDIPLNVIPSLLAMVGSRCKILTEWAMIREKQDVLKID